MKQGLIRLFFVILAVLSGIGLFVLKTKVIEQQRVLKEIHDQISEDSYEIQILKSEWADRNDPENLRRLIKAVNLKLVPITTPQVIQINDLPTKKTPEQQQKG